jgi:hypothetical protein
LSKILSTDVCLYHALVLSQIGADGQLIIDATSLTVTAQRSEVATYERVDEGAHRAVNSMTYMKRAPK